MRLGRAGEDLLAPVKHRDNEVQADLAVAKARDLLVATRTKIVHYVRGVMKSFGDRLPKCRRAAFAQKTPDGVPVLLKAALAPL